MADFITALQAASATSCGKPNPLERTRCWFPDVNLVSSTEANNIVTFALQATFSNPEVAAKAAAAATAQPIPGVHGRPAARRRRDRRRGGTWLTTHSRSSPWPASSASRCPRGRAHRRPLLVAVLLARHGGARRRRRRAWRPCSKEIRALEVTANKLAEFQREVALLEAKLETLKRILPPGQGDPGPDAQGPVPGRAVEPDHQDVHSRGDREQGVLPGVADQHGRRRATTTTSASSSTGCGGCSRLVNVGNLKIKSRSEPDGQPTRSAPTAWPRPSSTSRRRRRRPGARRAPPGRR